MSLSTSLRRRLTAVALSAMTAVALAVPPAFAAPEDQPAAAEAGATWIVAELAKDQPGFDVFGKTAARADVVYALASVGGYQAALRSALSDLRAGAADFVGTVDAPAVGSLAKVVLAASVTGSDPSDYIPGRELESELRAAMDDEGMFAPDLFTQSYAMLALGATDNGVPAEAVSALESRQCPDGFFTFMGDCPDLAAPDIDTTALALQALVAGGSPAASAAADALVEAQNPDGSFPNAFGDPNANSAGVAGQALRAANETAAADLAAEFVMSLQTDDGGFKFVAADTEANGFATLQAVLALGGPAYAELTTSVFADVEGDYLFADEIGWMGITGTTRGCNPPTNDRFCPDDNLTRGEMAAFLTRALDLNDAGNDTFTDDDGTTFERDIRRLAAAGITKGCNPPTNDRFCPDDNLTRGEMAAFLFRALGG